MIWREVLVDVWMRARELLVFQPSTGTTCIRAPNMGRITNVVTRSMHVSKLLQCFLVLKLSRNLAAASDAEQGLKIDMVI
eukprot:m.809855 g.809855  ORF g.809855 m.809855 type:complete len:80 (-) comp23383_c1_seq36:1916-2155(-)